MFVKTIEDFDKIERPKNIRKLSIEFCCSVCGKQCKGTYETVMESHCLLCRKHKIEATLAKHYGSAEAGRKANAEHGQATKREKGFTGEAWYKKASETMKLKHGVANPGEMEDHSSKCKETMKTHYGSLENAYRAMASNMDKTKTERYGEHYTNAIMKKWLDERGITNISQSRWWKQRRYEKSIARAEKLGVKMELHDDGFYYFHCDECGETHRQELNSIWHRCMSCYPVGYSKSSIEGEVFGFLQSIDGSFEKNRRSVFKENHHLEIDAYSEKLKLGIEIDGLYWHQSKDELSSLKKYDLAKSNGIRLVRIFDFEWRQKRSIIESYLRSLLGHFSQRVFARKCEVREIGNDAYRDFCESNHIQGSVPASVKLGLLYDGELVEIMSFTKPRLSKHYEWELARECSKGSVQIVGGKSKLFTYFVRHYKPQSIISYCEKRLFTGASYEKLGFTKLRDSRPSFIVSYNGEAFSRQSFTKPRMQRMSGFTFHSGMTQIENIYANGGYIAWNCGNFVLEWQ